MNISIDSRSSHAKKRKVNDGRDDTTKGAHDVDNDGGGFLSSASKSHDVNNIIPQLDRMEQMMMGMAEKLATVNSRCAELEAKCSSLENKLEDKVDKIQVRAQQYHEYNSMLVRNQKWEYSPEVESESHWVNRGHDEELATYLVETAEDLKDITIKMRRGEFPDGNLASMVKEGEGKGIFLIPSGPSDDGDRSMYSIGELLPHWKEFTAALKQFTPALQLLPDSFEIYFCLGWFVLEHDMTMLLKEALIGKPFTKICFVNNLEVDGGMSVDAILDIAESNTHLRRLEITQNSILSEHIERLCSIAHNHPLMELDLCGSIDDPGVGNSMLTSLLTVSELKLEKLCMRDNGITSDVSMMLADFLSTNPRLKELDLNGNELNDNDLVMIANALRSNTTLRQLELVGNGITASGLDEAFLPVLCDERSLNALSDSNHCCHVFGRVYPAISQLNSSEVVEVNRGRKIYSLLSSRNTNDTMSNVQHFGDIDVKLLPNMLDAVQKYAKFADEDEDVVESLSIVYEVMRKWEKVYSTWTNHHVDTL